MADNQLIVGNTDTERYDNMKYIYYLLRATAYPKRGTHEEEWNINDIAIRIQYHFGLSDLERIV